MHFFNFSGPWTNLSEMAPNGARRIFPTNPALAIILGRTDFVSEIFFDFVGSQIPRFPGPQISRSQKSGLGQAWAGLGPGRLHTDY